MVEAVNKHYTETLRLVKPMEPADSLSTYVLDSLSAVEVRNYIRKELGAEFMTLYITNANSLISLCKENIAKMPAVE